MRDFDMAIFRKIHVSFWSDSSVSDLDRDKKLFYIYLLTNERTKQCGIYEITKKQISFDLGYSIDTVSKLLNYFIKIGKIKYNDLTKEIAIKNWRKYNSSTSPKVQSCINKELELIKDRLLIEYINSIDIQTQEEEEEEQEEEEEKNNCDLFNQFILIFNSITNRGYKGDKKSKSQFNQRIKEKFSLLEFEIAIKNASNDKYLTENNYLTPEYITRSDKLQKWLNYKDIKLQDSKQREYQLPQLKPL